LAGMWGETKLMVTRAEIEGSVDGITSEVGENGGRVGEGIAEAFSCTI